MASEDLEELLTRADAALVDGALEEALELAEKAARLDQESPDAPFILGEALLDLGRPQEALEAYQRADRLLPDNASVLSGLGMALFDLVRFREAEEALQLAVRLDPELSEGHQTLGLILERQGKEKQAERHFKQARKLAPEIYPKPIVLSREDFDGCVEAALAELPEPVRQAIQNTPVLVEPFPAENDLTAGKPPLCPGILGMYRGPALTDRSFFNPWTQLPGEILLYQSNLQRAATSREELVAEIRTTVLHEVGHVLGLDEDDLDERGLA